MQNSSTIRNDIEVYNILKKKQRFYTPLELKQNEVQPRKFNETDPAWLESLHQFLPYKVSVFKYPYWCN